MKYPPRYLLMCINCGTVSSKHKALKSTFELTTSGALITNHKCIACGKKDFIDKDNWIADLETHPSDIEKRIDELERELEGAKFELSTLIDHIDTVWGRP